MRSIYDKGFRLIFLGKYVESVYLGNRLKILFSGKQVDFVGLRSR